MSYKTHKKFPLPNPHNTPFIFNGGKTMNLSIISFNISSTPSSSPVPIYITLTQTMLNNES